MCWRKEKFSPLLAIEARFLGHLTFVFIAFVTKLSKLLLVRYIF
jgi:hypothetical protein